jgi:hypothetical protein
MVGAPSEDPNPELSNAGRVYVFSGLNGEALFTLVSPRAKADGSFGHAVAGIGDVNSDDHHDMLIGAIGEGPGSSPEDAGRSYVVSGATGDTLFSLRSPNEEQGGSFGWAVAGVGDISDDGCPDLVVGAPREDPGSSPEDAGRAYAFSGATGELIFTMTGWGTPDEEFGYTVAGAGDTSNDGYDDILVGAPFMDNYGGAEQAGFVRRVSGATGSGLPVDLELFEQEYAWAGASVAGIGDADRDGFGDFAFGAPGYWYPSHPGRGGVEILSGATGAILEYSISSPHPQNYGYFGIAMACAGDVNNDWLTDVVIGAPFENPARAYVFEFDHPTLTLYGSVSPGSLQLTWDAVTGSAAYWVYGAPNDCFFEPRIEPPYQNRLEVVTGTSTSFPAGIGDPDTNWAYLVVAVNGLDLPLCGSNRVGAFDIQTMIP